MRLGDDGQRQFRGPHRSSGGGMASAAGGGNLLGCLLPLVAQPLRDRRRAHPPARLLRADQPWRRRRRILGGGGADRRARRRAIDARRPNSGELLTGVLGSTEQVWGEIFAAVGRALPADAAGRLHQRQPVGLRRGAGGDGAVLLPDRPEHLHRPDLLQRTVAAASARRAISPRPMSSRTRSAITSRTSRARSTRRRRRRRALGTRRGQCRSRSGSSCRPIAMPACGRRDAKDAQGSLLEPGDIEEGMRAAEAIGDDTLQKQTPGRGRSRKLHPRHRRRSAWKRFAAG